MSEDNSRELLDYAKSSQSSSSFFKDALINIDKIRKVDFDLSKTNNFPTGIVKSVNHFFSRRNVLYFGIMTGEEIVLIQDTVGDVSLSIINKEQIAQKIKSLKHKNKISYIHLATVQIILKSTFNQGIDCPIELALLDDRLIKREDATLAKGVGNLSAGKIKFDLNLRQGMSLLDEDLDRSIFLSYKLLRTDLFHKGNHPFSITYRVNYALSNSHHSIDFVGNDRIHISDLFSQVVQLDEPPRLTRIKTIRPSLQQTRQSVLTNVPIQECIQSSTTLGSTSSLPRSEASHPENQAVLSQVLEVVQKINSSLS